MTAVVLDFMNLCLEGFSEELKLEEVRHGFGSPHVFLIASVTQVTVKEPAVATPILFSHCQDPRQRVSFILTAAETRPGWSLAAGLFVHSVLYFIFKERDDFHQRA